MMAGEAPGEHISIGAFQAKLRCHVAMAYSEEYKKVFTVICYLSDLLPAYLLGRWPDDRGVLACRVGVVQLPGGQKISRDCHLLTVHKEPAP